MQTPWGATEGLPQAQAPGMGSQQQAWNFVVLLHAGCQASIHEGLSFPGCREGQYSHSIPVLYPPCHRVSCANHCSALQPTAEPEASWLIAVAVLELGTDSSHPQSRNYHHLAWVSDLEQGAAQPALPPAASRPTTGNSFAVHNNNSDDNSSHLSDTRCGPGSGSGFYMQNRAYFCSSPSSPLPAPPALGLLQNC